MKYIIKDYALVLYDISQIKKESERELAVKDFLNIIKEHYVESWLQNIFQVFESIYKKNKKHTNIEIISARQLKDNHLQDIKKIIYKYLHNTNIEIKQSVNNDILGGFLVEGENLRIKASLKDKLNALQF